jgi:hypothetical protein
MSTPREVSYERKRYKEWLDIWQPYNDDGSYAYFENTKENCEYLKTLDPKYVWTSCEYSGGNQIISGFWNHENDFGYYVTKQPWYGSEAGQQWYPLEVYIPCKACDSSGLNKRGQDCSKCKGDGITVYYVD